MMKSNNDDSHSFSAECAKEIYEQGQNEALKSATRDWLHESAKHNYSYHFEWLGRPIIQYPQDIVGTQQLIWNVQPDLIIETGIARGGSLIFYASILELIAQCGGPSHAKVLGIDIDIRAHNKAAILGHQMSKRIDMIEGSSVDTEIVEQVKKYSKAANKIMVFLDSNHTHEHVLKELQFYAPLVSQGSYAIVFDTVVEDLDPALFENRPWEKGNNPKTAVHEFLREVDEENVLAEDGSRLNFMVDEDIEKQLLITVAPSGFLKRI